MIKHRIINWIRREVKTAKAKGIVLGLSGGIDSAVVASLAKAAAGKTRVLGLSLPCHSQPEDIKYARLMARKLGIGFKLADLSAIFDAFTRILPKAPRQARANLKPRLRMAVLYYYANKLNYLVAGTGNKSELMAGYFTKYGDGAVDILPIGNLFKKDVVKLARELGVPEQIIIRPPTAGLWPGQTDEGEMGITYRELDDILSRMETGRKQAACGKLVNKVKKMVAGSEHKRKITSMCVLR